MSKLNAMLILADQLKIMRDRQKELKDELKDVNGEVERLERELADMMLQEEVPNFNRNGHLFYISTRTFASPAAGQRDALYSWLKAHGYGDLVQETVHAGTLSSFIKELLEEADELPEGLDQLVNVYDKTSVNVRRSKV